MKTKTVHVRADLHKRLAVTAIDEDKSIQLYTEQIIESALDKRAKKAKRKQD